MQTNKKLSRTGKKSTFRQYYRNKLFSASAATGQTIRQEIPLFTKESNIRPENVQNNKRKKVIKTTFGFALHPPWDLTSISTHFLFFFNAHFRLLCVYDRKGEGRERECDKWRRNEWFRWLRALIRVDDADGDTYWRFPPSQTFSNGTKQISNEMIFSPVWGSEENALSTSL